VIRAVVFGVNGQDGTYLAEHLLACGATVLGIGRQEAARYLAPQAGFKYLALDVADAPALTLALQRFRPTHAFHFAAVHGPAGFAYEPVWGQALGVHVGALHTLLEHARTAAKDLRIVYASSAKVFRTPLPARITEDSPMASSCLYSTTKNAARDVISLYRSRHGVRASILYFFNHESVLRAADYFIPRICGVLTGALASGGRASSKTSFKTLDFFCDWGSAREYMEIAASVADIGDAGDFVVATGRTWHGREFVDALFERHGLDYRYFITTELDAADPGTKFECVLDRLETSVGRRPRVDIMAVCDEIIQQSQGLKAAANTNA
jgi:GDPmannose 4,6-dehydratase